MLAPRRQLRATAVVRARVVEVALHVGHARRSASPQRGLSIAVDVELAGRVADEALQHRRAGSCASVRVRVGRGRRR